MRLKDMRPLILSVKRGKWRAGGEDPHNNPAFLKARKSALARDSDICQFCGWSDGKWMEAHHVDGNHDHNEPGNLVACCRWCHRVHHIGLAGTYDLGFLALSLDPSKPLIAQNLINEWARHYDWATRGQRPAAAYYEKCKLMQEVLELCVGKAEQVLGTSNPAELANILLRSSDQEYDQRMTWMKDIRLVPMLLDELDESIEEHRAEKEVRLHWISVLDKRHGLPA